MANLTVLRLMRTFRVLRLFGRLKDVRLIINALTASIVPVTHAFFIVAVVMALFAIIGVTFFEDDAPDEFGNLSRSLIAMFRIAGGETWAETIPIVNETGDGPGTVNWKFGLFISNVLLTVAFLARFSDCHSKVCRTDEQCECSDLCARFKLDATASECCRLVGQIHQ